MWCVVTCEILPLPIYCTVSADGVLYVRATDVAKILMYKNASHFAHRRSCLQVKDIVYKKLGLPASTLRTRVMSILDVVYEFKKSRRFAPEEDEFEKMFSSDSLNAKILSEYEVSPNIHRPLSVQLVPRHTLEESFSAREFFDAFVHQTLEMYEKMSLEVEEKEEDWMVAEFFTDSVAYGINRRPKIVHLFFDNDPRPAVYERVA